MTSIQFLRSLAVAFVVTGVFIAQAFPQSSAANQSPRNVLFTGMPGVVLPQVHALGDRVTRPGREITILNGRFQEQNGKTSAVRVTLELPQSVEIIGLKSAGAAVKFDSASPALPTDPDDAVLLETFSTDTVEGFLAAIKDGGEIEIIGFGIEPVDISQANSPAAYDVFAIRSPVKARSDRLSRTKYYYFDSATGYLMKTRYENDRNEVEVRFLQWHREGKDDRSDGSAYPGRIERYENNQLLFSFDVLSVVARPQSDGGAIR